MAIAWHRILGMALTQYLAGTAWKVDVEVDLSLRQQRLDVVILRGLADRVDLRPHGPGAYDVQWGTDSIRILVLHEMPEAAQNLVWNLFSGDPERIAGAFGRLQPRRQSWSSLVNQLLGYYGLEGM